MRNFSYATEIANIASSRHEAIMLEQKKKVDKNWMNLNKPVQK